MSTIMETKGAVVLSISEKAENSTDRASNERQYAAMKQRLTAEVESRGGIVTPWYFTQGHYKHGGVQLWVRYDLVKPTHYPVSEIESPSDS